MQRRISRKSVLALIVSLLCLIAGAALGETEFKKNTIYVTLGETAAEAGQIPAESIASGAVNGKWYLFLPGNQSLDGLRVWFTGVSEITIDEKAYSSGDAWPGVTAGTKYSVKIGGKKFGLTVMQGSAIPSLQILTESRSMKKIDKSKKVRETGQLLMIDGGGNVAYDGALEHIRLRGNTSAKFGRKGYQIKLAAGTDLLGMGKAKKWVLTSNHSDHSLLRNQITLAMAKYVGLPYTSECAQVEVYLNHVYNGTYILLEKIEIGKNRVNITDLEKATEAVNTEPLDSYAQKGPRGVSREKFKYVDIPVDPEDITGGYLVEYENWQPRYRDEKCAYTTKQGKVISVKEPENASQAQMTYISDLFQGFENAIFAPDGRDPATGKHYSEFVDAESLVLKYMLEEISKNTDGSQSSLYFFKPADSESRVAFAGPAWDYDRSYGDYADSESDKRNMLPASGFVHNSRSGSRYWWPELYKLPDFREKITEMWNGRYADAIAVLLGEKEGNTDLRSIDAYAGEVRASAEMTFTAFPFFEERKTNLARCGKNFEENIAYLKKFITERRDFLAGEWGTCTP